MCSTAHSTAGAGFALLQVGIPLLGGETSDVWILYMTQAVSGMF